MKEEETLTPEEEGAIEPEEEEVDSGAEEEVPEEEETEEEQVEAEAEEEPDTAVEIEEETEVEEVETVPVNFSWCPPMPETVFIAGAFNDWNPCSHQLTCSETGEWEITLDLAPGTYEYKLIIDGEWMADPTCEDKVPDPFGSYNSVLKVE